MKPYNDIQATTFAEREFARNNVEQFDAYIEYRVRGYHMSTAFNRVFGEHNKAHLCCEYLEHNDYYHWKFKQRLNEVKASDLWDEKIAIHELLSTVRNPFFKDSTRLQAMKELNILTNIVIVDENGKTKSRTLAELYGELKKQIPAAEV